MNKQQQDLKKYVSSLLHKENQSIINHPNKVYKHKWKSGNGRRKDQPMTNEGNKNGRFAESFNSRLCLIFFFWRRKRRRDSGERREQILCGFPTRRRDYLRRFSFFDLFLLLIYFLFCFWVF